MFDLITTVLISPWCWVPAVIFLWLVCGAVALRWATTPEERKKFDDETLREVCLFILLGPISLIWVVLGKIAGMI